MVCPFSWERTFVREGLLLVHRTTASFIFPAQGIFWFSPTSRQMLISSRPTMFWESRVVKKQAFPQIHTIDVGKNKTPDWGNSVFDIKNSPFDSSLAYWPATFNLSSPIHHHVVILDNNYWVNILLFLSDTGQKW